MSYVIWGCGNRGTNIYQYFENNVIAFIDSDINKIGTTYKGLPVISPESFFREYVNHILIISPLHDENILEYIATTEFKDYLCSNDVPKEVVDEYRPEVARKIIQSLQKRKVLLVGLNLWSVYLGNELKEANIKVRWRRDKEIEDTLIDKLKVLEDLDIQNSTNSSDEETVLVVSAKYSEETVNHIARKEWIDCFYLGCFLPDWYQNKKIENYNNKYAGKRCFIVATGPSVRTEDLDLLAIKHEFCFSMNKIFYGFDKTIWRPDIYVGEDANLLKYYGEDIKEHIDGLKFFADTYQNGIDYGESAYTFHMSYPKKSDRPGYGEDFSFGYVSGYSVVFACIYLAIYMGFAQIYIIGADMNYSNDMTASGNHFYGDKDIISKQDGSINQPFFFDTVHRNYEFARMFAKVRGVNIFNATRGGKLEAFERVDFDELMGQTSLQGD